ncbi:MAG TPA: L,D-transpeptidase family protein [Flavobacterium sp.]|nr:L,D-transpeptidase family protein [Flavobacterium sp.]
MNKYLLLFFLIAFIGCKKPAKPEIKSVGKTFKHEMKGLAIDSVFLQQYENGLLSSFYKMNGYETVWSKPELRKSVTEMLSKSAEDGLNPDDYGTEKLLKYESKINFLSQKQLVQYDILMTQALQKYLSHMANGKLNPKVIYANWDLPRNKFDVNVRLSEGISGDSLDVVIEKAKPTHLVYKRLKTALQLIDGFPKDNLKKIVTDKKIVRNDSSEVVLNIKKRLIYWKDMKATDTLTAVYDRQMLKAVKKFQWRHGLSADGVIGKGTVAALNYTKKQRKEQIIANLERWKWFPRNMGDHYIIINLPDYTLRIVKDNDTIEEKRVVVGKTERKTPVLTSTFNNIVFNPTWTVPPTIIREDLTPAATKNRGYFAEKGITIYNWKGDTVSAEKWNPAKFNSYRYVQKPGNDNSLGNVKFNFPNHYTVYLHDTNHRDFFVKNYRSLSSGCVRVENPLPLAAYMLNDSIRWPLDSINKLIATAKTKVIRLKEKIRIHQLYWTAWSENNELIFRDDIYNLDADLYDKLRK